MSNFAKVNTEFSMSSSSLAAGAHIHMSAMAVAAMFALSITHTDGEEHWEEE